MNKYRVIMNNPELTEYTVSGSGIYIGPNYYAIVAENSDIEGVFPLTVTIIKINE